MIFENYSGDIYYTCNNFEYFYIMRIIIFITILTLIGCKKKEENPNDDKLPKGTSIQATIYCTYKNAILKVENLTQNKYIFDIRQPGIVDTVNKQAITGCYFNINDRDRYRIQYEVEAFDLNPAYLKKPLSIKIEVSISGKIIIKEFGAITQKNDTTLFSTGEYFIN